MLEINLYHEIMYENLKFSNPIKNKNSESFSVEIFVEDKGKKKNIAFQTPRLLLINDPFINNSRAHIDLELNPNTADFYDFLHDLEDFCIITCHKNCLSWFGKNFPLDILDEFFTSIIKSPDKNNDYPFIRCKIPIQRKELRTKIFNEDKEEIDINDLKKNDKILNIIKIVGLKFLKKQIILELECIQIKKINNKKNEIASELNNSNLESDDDLLLNEINNNLNANSKNQITIYNDDIPINPENPTIDKKHSIQNEINQPNDSIIENNNNNLSHLEEIDMKSFNDYIELSDSDDEDIYIHDNVQENIRDELKKFTQINQNDNTKDSIIGENKKVIEDSIKTNNPIHEKIFDHANENNMINLDYSSDDQYLCEDMNMLS